MLEGKAEELTGSEMKLSECYFPNLKSCKGKKKEMETNAYGRALKGTVFVNTV